MDGLCPVTSGQLSFGIVSSVGVAFIFAPSSKRVMISRLISIWCSARQRTTSIESSIMKASPKFSTVDGSRFVADCGSFLTSLSRGILLFLVGIYRTIGTTHFGGQCRFEPSCSEYAVEVLRVHRPGSAVRLICIRLCKCRPGGPFGYDPVPPVESGEAALTPKTSLGGH